jgi:hypothetical protein
MSLSPNDGEISNAIEGLNPPGHPAKPSTPDDTRLHKPGVAGSSPAAASLQFSEPIDTYHSDREWWSKSQLWGLRSNGPLWFHQRYFAHAIQSPQSDSLARGTLVHEWAEQGPDAWWDRVVVVPAEFIGANGALLKKGQEWRDTLASEAIVLKQGEVESYRAQFAQLSANPIFQKLTEETEHREFSIRATCPDSGLKVRCRPDAATEWCLWDLKTTRDQQPLKMFHKAVHDYGYGFQASLYLKLARLAGFTPSQFVFVVSSTVPPFECHAVVLPQPYLEQSDRQVIETCRELNSRIALDHWQSSEAGQLTELFMPHWTMEESHAIGRSTGWCE